MRHWRRTPLPRSSWAYRTSTRASRTTSKHLCSARFPCSGASSRVAPAHRFPRRTASDVGPRPKQRWTCSCAWPGAARGNSTRNCWRPSRRSDTGVSTAVQAERLTATATSASSLIVRTLAPHGPARDSRGYGTFRSVVADGSCIVRSMGLTRRSAATLAAAVLIAGTATAYAAWQQSDPCRDLSSSSGLPLAATTSDYVGLRPAQAVALGKERGVVVRVTCKDRQRRVVTADLRDDRINVGVNGDKVVGAAAF